MEDLRHMLLPCLISSSNNLTCKKIREKFAALSLLFIWFGSTKKLCPTEIKNLVVKITNGLMNDQNILGWQTNKGELLYESQSGNYREQGRASISANKWMDAYLLQMRRKHQCTDCKLKAAKIVVMSYQKPLFWLLKVCTTPTACPGSIPFHPTYIL